jgi:APA family basic amino acid/polyamine antiporter
MTGPAVSMRHGLGLWSATALVVGHTIAVGIFLTPAELIGALASPALTIGLWIVCGALVLAGALTFGELAARYPLAGGPYIYLREGWGERIAFLYGWQSLLVMDPGITAALAAGLSQYVIVLWPRAAGGERWVAIGVIWGLALLAMGGLKLSVRVLGVLTALKLLALAGVVLLALASGAGNWSHFAPFIGTRIGAPPLMEAVAIALIAAFFSFGGFWEASRVASEIDDPGRTLPRALALGVASVTVVYVVTTCAFIYLMPPDAVSSAPEFARRAGEAMLGGAGVSVFASIVVLSVTVSMMALLVMAPRLYVAMSDDGLFPRALASVRHRTGAPARSTALMALLASMFVLVGTLQEIVAFFICTALGFIALAASALFVVRRRSPAAIVFQVPGYPVTPLLFVVLLAGVIVLIAINRPIQAFAGFAIVALGVPAHWLLRSRGGLTKHVSRNAFQNTDHDV